MKKFPFFLILVLLLAYVPGITQSITGYGVQFGSGPDSNRVYIIQEQRAGIPEGGWQTVQTVRDMPSIQAAESLILAQMRAADAEMERVVKLKKDLTSVSEAISKRKAEKTVADVKKPAVVKKE